MDVSVTDAARQPQPRGEGTSARALAAFTAVYRAELAYVWKVLGRLGARNADKEDLAHDVFATAYRHWSAYDPTRPIRPWLFGIAYRRMLDFNRKFSNHRELLVDAPETQDLSADAEQVVLDGQLRSTAEAIIASLEVERRAVFVMAELEGQTMPEISEALGVPLNTAYSRLRLARRDFNAKVEALGLRGEGGHG